MARPHCRCTHAALLRPYSGISRSRNGENYLQNYIRAEARGIGGLTPPCTTPRRGTLQTSLDLSERCAGNKSARSSVLWAPHLKRSDPIMSASFPSSAKNGRGLASTLFCGILVLGLGFAGSALAAGDDDSGGAGGNAAAGAMGGASGAPGSQKKPESLSPISRHAPLVRSGTRRPTSAWRGTAASCPIQT
jgi:hypothetical protein